MVDVRVTIDTILHTKGDEKWRSMAARLLDSPADIQQPIKLGAE